MNSCLPLVPYLFKMTPYWSMVSHNGLINFFAIGQPSLQCTSRSPSYFNNTGGTLKGIMTLHSAFEKADR
jgi:hypothetical protein